MTILEQQLCDYFTEKEVSNGIYITCITNKSLVCTNVCVYYMKLRKKNVVNILGDFAFHDKATIIHGYTPLQEVIMTRMLK